MSEAPPPSYDSASAAGYVGPYPPTGHEGMPQPGYPQPTQQGYPPPQPGYPPPQQGYPPPQQGYPPPQQGYPPPQQGYPPPSAPYPLPGQNGAYDDDDNEKGEIDDDPAYPPGSNPTPYYNPAWNLQPHIFSDDFSKQYMADYSSPGEDGGVTLSPGFIPPNAVPPNEITEVDSFVCMPDKSDSGCCYYARLVLSSLAHIAFVGCLLGIIIMAATNENIEVGLYIGLGVSYGILLIETFLSYDIRYLCDIKDGRDFKSFMEEVHGATPSLMFHIECYHYETRYRTVYYTDSNGHRRSRTESRRVRVTTYRESEPFLFQFCQDLAPPNINVEGKKATRIVFYRTFQFGDERTRASFEAQSANIRNRNRNRDRHMSYYENFDIHGFTERMLAFIDDRARHPCFHPGIYIVASIFLCTWPFRWWFRRVTAKTSYTFIKQLTV